MDEITLAGLRLTLPSGRPLFATSLAREKSAAAAVAAAATVFTSYRADIAPLPSETVLTCKQNDASGDDTHAASWMEFWSEQFYREITSPRAFSLEKRLLDKGRELRL